MSDHANNAAAVAAGWTRVQTDRGVGRSPRYITEYSKPLVGASAAGADSHGYMGDSDVSQAAADTTALNALNGARNVKYGRGASANADSRGGSMTHDVN